MRGIVYSGVDLCDGGRANKQTNDVYDGRIRPPLLHTRRVHVDVDGSVIHVPCIRPRVAASSRRRYLSINNSSMG